jgi:hypothetical protein
MLVICASISQKGRIQVAFTTEQLVTRFEARRRILNVMGIYSQMHLLQQDKDIYGELWSQQEDVCLGLNNGYYVGAKDVAGYYRAQGEKIQLINQVMRQVYPDKLGDKPEEKTYGVGRMNYFPLDTPVVEIAADGETAKGIWALRNNYADVTSRGPEAFWQWAYVAVDFIREENDYKIWHLLLLSDVFAHAGQKLHETADTNPELKEFEAIKAFNLPKPTVETVVRPLYQPNRPFTEPPRLPEPYETFADTFSYGYTERGTI